MSKLNNTLTQSRIKELLHYDPLTGAFTWRIKPSDHIAAGEIAGGVAKSGYWLITVYKKTYRAHRLAWVYMNGVWPAHDIDHEDTNRSNNIFDNLRDVTRMVNKQNRRSAQANNKSCGLLGVTKDKKRWNARIKVGAKYIHLGNHDTPQQAHEAYLQAKRIYHEGNTL